MGNYGNLIREITIDLNRRKADDVMQEFFREIIYETIESMFGTSRVISLGQMGFEGLVEKLSEQRNFLRKPVEKNDYLMPEPVAVH